MLQDKAAVNIWLLVNAAGIVAAFVAGQGVLAVLGWVLGGVAAVVLMQVKPRRGR